MGDGLPGMQGGRVLQRTGLLLHQQPYFGAATYHTLGSPLNMAADYGLVLPARELIHHAPDQFLVDDAIYRSPIFRIRGDDFQAKAFPQPVGVETVLPGELRTTKADSGFTFSFNGISDGIHSVQQGKLMSFSKLSITLCMVFVHSTADPTQQP